LGSGERAPASYAGHDLVACFLARGATAVFSPGEVPLAAQAVAAVPHFLLLLPRRSVVELFPEPTHGARVEAPPWQVLEDSNKDLIGQSAQPSIVPLISVVLAAACKAVKILVRTTIPTIIVGIVFEMIMMIVAVVALLINVDTTGIARTILFYPGRVTNRTKTPGRPKQEKT
jgi:hypothetical protein